jgi:hypothetical protein
MIIGCKTMNKCEVFASFRNVKEHYEGEDFALGYKQYFDQFD